MSAWLHVALALPLFGAVVLALLPRQEDRLARHLALAFSLATLAVVVSLCAAFVPTAGMQFETRVPWIPSLGVGYHVGVDGFSVFLVLLTAVFTPICLFAARGAVTQRWQEFGVAMLWLEAAMLGALVALDLVLFFVCWELMLVPMALVIGVWGSEQRHKAAIKFFLFTMCGSVGMLVAILVLAVAFHDASGGTWSFDLFDLDRVLLSPVAQNWCFWGFMVGLAVKIPLVPLHTWLPDAHTQAPTPGSVILAGVLLKLGTYGMLRFALPLFPLGAAESANVVAWLAVGGIVYGALVAYVQKDVKRLVAYSSVSHMGFIVLGIVAVTPQGWTGATFQSLAHGLTTGALFLCIGVIYERRHTRQMSELGGLATSMPVFFGVFLIAVLGSAGLPGLVGFVGEFLILVGTWKHGGFVLGEARVLGAVAATGVVLGAVYLLWLFQKTMLGPSSSHGPTPDRDLSWRERLVLVPVVGCIVLLGLFPAPLLDRIEPTSVRMVEAFNRKWCQSLEVRSRPLLATEAAKDRCAEPAQVLRGIYGDRGASASAREGRAGRRDDDQSRVGRAAGDGRPVPTGGLATAYPAVEPSVAREESLSR